jgi:hypothetical protein
VPCRARRTRSSHLDRSGSARRPRHIKDELYHMRDMCAVTHPGTRPRHPTAGSCQATSASGAVRWPQAMDSS